MGEVALGAAAMGGLLYICVYTKAFGFSVGSADSDKLRRNGRKLSDSRSYYVARNGFQFRYGGLFADTDVFSAAPLIRLLVLRILFAGRLMNFHLAYLGIPFALYECDVSWALYPVLAYTKC